MRCTFRGRRSRRAWAYRTLGCSRSRSLRTRCAGWRRASGLPFIVDADTGFGEAINVIRTVKDLEAAGAAAIQIEDQVLPKRCGHLDGKTVVSTDAFVEKIAAAAQARKDMLIIARRM